MRYDTRRLLGTILTVKLGSTRFQRKLPVTVAARSTAGYYWQLGLVFKVFLLWITDYQPAFVDKDVQIKPSSTLPAKKVKVAHTRLPSVGFRSWSQFLAVSLQVTWVINLAVGCHYCLPGLQLPPQPLRGLLPILLLGEQRHNGCEQFAWNCYPTASRLRFEPRPFCAWVQQLTTIKALQNVPMCKKHFSAWTIHQSSTLALYCKWPSPPNYYFPWQPTNNSILRRITMHSIDVAYCYRRTGIVRMLNTSVR